MTKTIILFLGRGVGGQEVRLKSMLENLKDYFKID
jgi:hypothetical protein